MNTINDLQESNAFLKYKVIPGVIVATAVVCTTAGVGATYCVMKKNG
jgi:hypothetical protein